MDSIAAGISRLTGKIDASRPWMVLIPNSGSPEEVVVDIMILMMVTVTIGWGHRLIARCAPKLVGFSKKTLYFWTASTILTAILCATFYTENNDSPASPTIENPYLKMHEPTMRFAALQRRNQTPQKNNKILVPVTMGLMYFLVRLRTSKKYKTTADAEAMKHSFGKILFVTGFYMYPMYKFGFGVVKNFYSFHAAFVMSLLTTCFLLASHRCSSVAKRVQMTMKDPRLPDSVQIGKAWYSWWAGIDIGPGNMYLYILASFANVFWGFAIGTRSVRILVRKSVFSIPSRYEVPPGILKMFGRTGSGGSIQRNGIEEVFQYIAAVCFVGLAFYFMASCVYSLLVSSCLVLPYQTSQLPSSDALLTSQPKFCSTTVKIPPQNGKKSLPTVRLGLVFPVSGPLYLKNVTPGGIFTRSDSGIQNFLFRKLLKLDGEVVKQRSDVSRIVNRNIERAVFGTAESNSEEHEEEDEEVEEVNKEHEIEVTLEFERVEPRFVTLGRRSPSVFSSLFHPKERVNLYDTGSAWENLSEVFF
eukprot:TRINITY_DN5428_c0_g1_i1.p1 TRINITY_DN5428_c0_g1~~TRINITY_DN5428_c0_g1_i1.p1  ORF type:complete len:530 (+),score=38.31 TRINITY_DN5428_c0_g1_i1:57-1646(+)